MVQKINHYIHGQYVDFTGGTIGQVYNPATGDVSGEITYAEKDDINKVVESAYDAQKIWGNMSAPKRAAILFKFRELLIKDKDNLANILGAEHGKTIPDALGEIQRGIDVVEFACGIPHLIKGSFNPNIGGNIDLYSLREPVGIVGGITPFNFPVMIPLWMGAMAIACGNAFINKPSERDPSAALRLAELFTEAGLPDGVWNCVIGDKRDLLFLAS